MRRVYLLPLGTVEPEILSAAETAIFRSFGLDVYRMEASACPEYAYDAGRQQYSSELILRTVVQSCPEVALRLVAITKADLFIPMLTFVYGQAQLGGKASVVSYARLEQEFYGLNENRTLTLNRTMKETTHEVGHTFGLTHCRSNACPMSLSTDVDQLDYKGDELCSNCRILFRDFISRMHGE